MLTQGDATFGYFFTIAELALIAATLLPLSRSAAWWIRTLDFPRIQIAIMAAGVLAADLALRTAGGASAPVIRAALALCFLYQLYQIRPYTMFAGKEVQPAKAARWESTLSLLLANVKMENRNAARLREIIAAAISRWSSRRTPRRGRPRGTPS